MIIIGMTGPIGHGKSTFAKALAELEPTTKRIESSMLVAEVANALHASTKIVPQRDNIDEVNNWLRPLPAILLEIVQVHTDFETIKLDPIDVAEHPIEYEKLFLHLDNLANKPGMLRQNINHENKEAYRPILQWLGGYLVKKLDPKIWYREIIRRAYKLDDEGCKLCIISGLRFPADAELVHEAGGKIIKVYRPGHLQYDMLDPTERERDGIPVDATVVSDSDIDGVRKCAAKVLNDLKNSDLQSNYVVSQLPED